MIRGDRENDRLHSREYLHLLHELIAVYNNHKNEIL